ncbi:lysozyme inhibitor LprI family protein [Bacillus seohaeanensis]|jgi:uncharacterized protein YecT (DUF1311 family)|uniref:Lysozyme inhibitor LprI family protein n=1 Tax=Bacillus seohaeanensis TaxID=284580 RepID=A0ABW5RUP3_9BACI
MKNNHRVLMGMLIIVLVILAACGNSPDESSTPADNDSENNNVTQDTKEEASNSDSKENASNTDNTNTDVSDQENKDTNKKVDTSDNVPAKEEAPSTNHTEGNLKEEYLQKLKDAKKETEELEATDSSTYALKKVENDRWEIWDELLNEIYGKLKEQLPPEEMDELREEQRKWIEYRDDNALKASLKYKGGTQEHLEYVAVLANLTEERCFELVEEYMK